MDTPPPADRPPERKPWPMIWIVAAIAGYVVIYTVVNVAFRKPAPPHEPWVEARERRLRVVQTSMMGWSRLAATIEPAANPAGEASTPLAEVASTPPPVRLDKALPVELVLIAPGRPALHPGPGVVRAPASAAPNAPLRLQLEFPANASPVALGEALAYAKDRRLFIFVQDASRVSADAAPVAQERQLDLVLALPQLEAGMWQAELHAASATFRWEFVVP
jgi:hypothetical protein